MLSPTTKLLTTATLRDSKLDITEALQKDESVTFPGFGSFKVIRQKARRGRNPRTGEAMHIPARKVPKFTPAKALRETVNT